LVVVQFNDEELDMAAAAVESLVRKSEAALSHQRVGSAQWSLLSRRLPVFRASLRILEAQRLSGTVDVSATDFDEVRTVLPGIIESLQPWRERFEIGTPQRTGLDRRIGALQMSLDLACSVNSVTESVGSDVLNGVNPEGEETR
jgi:hypothetical protein